MSNKSAQITCHSICILDQARFRSVLPPVADPTACLLSVRFAACVSTAFFAFVPTPAILLARPVFFVLATVLTVRAAGALRTIVVPPLVLLSCDARRSSGTARRPRTEATAGPCRLAPRGTAVLAFGLSAVRASDDAVCTVAAGGTDLEGDSGFNGDTGRAILDLKGDAGALKGDCGSVRELLDFGDKTAPDATRLIERPSTAFATRARFLDCSALVFSLSSSARTALVRLLDLAGTGLATSLAAFCGLRLIVGLTRCGVETEIWDGALLTTRVLVACFSMISARVTLRSATGTRWTLISSLVRSDCD